ncbi:MAG: hypothetical protein ACRD0G_12670 [Acidimicrobiales bacterium]
MDAVPRLYLDQKDWIGLAQVRTGKPGSEELRATAIALETRVRSGLIITPMSESHVLETGTISDPTKRGQVATVIVALSRREALAPLHSIWVAEARSFFRHQFGAEVQTEATPFGKGLAFALGFSYDDNNPPWSDDAPDAEVAMAETSAIAMPSRIGMSTADIERRTRWESWADFITSQSRKLLEQRHRYNERDRLAAITLAMLDRALIGEAIGLDVHEHFLEFLERAGPWAAVRQMPSLAVLTELLRVRCPDISVAWTRNDYHDIHFLSVALAYCAAVCPDRRWAELALRSDYVVERGAIIASGRDALPDALERLGL